MNLEVDVDGKMTDKLLTDELRKVGRKDKLRSEREDTDEQHDFAQKIQEFDEGYLRGSCFSQPLLP